jgi:hypothetical protein
VSKARDERAAYRNQDRPARRRRAGPPIN